MHTHTTMHINAHSKMPKIVFLWISVFVVISTTTTATLKRVNSDPMWSEEANSVGYVWCLVYGPVRDGSRREIIDPRPLDVSRRVTGCLLRCRPKRDVARDGFRVMHTHEYTRDDRYKE